jgi:hypothetical protein
MTPQQQAIALYEAMGLKVEIVPGCNTLLGEWDGGDRNKFLPPIDHNFLAQAREKLMVTERKQRLYVDLLMLEFDRSILTDLVYSVINASPTQQLTALLKAVGLWKDVE